MSDKFKTNFPDDASGQIRGDLLNKIGRALNAIKPQKEEANRRRTDCDRIVNLSSTALVRGQVLQLGDTFNDRGAGADDITRTIGTDQLRPIFYEPCLVGVEPVGRVHEIAVLQENAAVGETAECQLDGVCTAWVNITSKAHRFAKAVAGSHYLQSAMCGHARIYWSPNETGLKLCRVRLGPPHAVHLLAYTPVNGISAASVTGLSATAGSAVCQLWQREFPGGGTASGIHTNPTDTGSAILTETIYNWFEDEVEGSRLVLVVSDDDFLFNVFCHDYPEQSSVSSASTMSSSSASASTLSSCSESSISSSTTGSSLSSVSTPSSVSKQTASSESSQTASSESSQSPSSQSASSVSSLTVSVSLGTDDPCPGTCGYIWTTSATVCPFYPPGEEYGSWGVHEASGTCGPVEECECPEQPARCGLYDGEIVVYDCIEIQV